MRWHGDGDLEETAAGDPMTPLSDAKFEVECKVATCGDLDCINRVIADACHHRAEVKRREAEYEQAATIAMSRGLDIVDLRAELTKARAENGALRKLVARVAEQQAMPDDSWREELAALTTTEG